MHLGHIHASYSTFVAILSRGLVCHATCSCPAGLGGPCSHVAGLLFYIAKLKAGNIDSIPEDTTCTGKPCEWNKPPRRDVQPQHLTDIKFRKLEFGKDTSGPLRHSGFLPGSSAASSETKLSHDRDNVYFLLGRATGDCACIYEIACAGTKKKKELKKCEVIKTVCEPILLCLCMCVRVNDAKTNVT